MDIIENQFYRNSLNEVSSMLNNMSGRILVTGATGLIGSCIVDTLLFANKHHNASFEVFALSRSKERLQERFAYARNKIYFVEQDVVEKINIDDLDYIICAASNADPILYSSYPVQTACTNILGALSALEYCKGKKTRALLCSSFEVYGRLDKGTFCESDMGVTTIGGKRDSYPESKRTAEMLFNSYFQEYKVDAVIARLSSVYGPTMKPNDTKAHAEFIKKGIAGENIVLKSDGKQVRSYTYVMDAVSALLTILFKGKAGETYNVSNKESIASIREVANCVAELCNVNILVDSEIDTTGHYSVPQNVILMSEKLERLGWRGKYSLREGIYEVLRILEN